MPLYKLQEVGGGGGTGGAGCLIDVSSFPGATLGAKLIAAIAALPATGGVLDCRCLTGAQSIVATVTVNKSCEIWFGASVITVTASPGLYVTQGTGLGNGSIIVGAGPGVTIFRAAGGVTPIIQIEGNDVTVRDLQVQYTSRAAGNRAIQIQAGPDGNVLRPRLENLILYGSGSRITNPNQGDGISFGTCFVGSVTGCFIYGWLNGIHFLDLGNNSGQGIIIHGGNRIYDNTEGILCEGIAVNVYGNIIEGNAHYGVHLVKGFILESIGNQYENTLDEFGVLTAQNIHIDGIVSAFFRSYSSLGDTFATPAGATRDIYLGVGTNQYVRGQSEAFSAGVEIGAGQPPAGFVECNFVGGAVQIGEMTLINPTSWTGSTTLDLSFPTWNSIGFARTYTNTAVASVAYVSVTTSLNPGANSATSFLGFNSVTSIFLGNVRAFTGVLVGGTFEVTHSGTGAASDLRGVYSIISKNAGAAGSVVSGACFYGQITNSVASNWGTAASFLAAVPVNSAGGIITDWYGLLIQDPVTANITNKYAIKSFGGNLTFTLGATYTFIIPTAADSNAFNVLGATNSVGIGAPADAAIKLFVNSAWTDTTSVNGIVNTTQFNPTANTAATYAGQSSTTFVTGGNVRNFTGQVIGFYQTTENRGANPGVVSNLWGLYSVASNASTGTVTDMTGLRITIQNTSTGTVANAEGITITTPINSGGGTFNNYYALLIQDNAAVTIGGARVGVAITGVPGQTNGIGTVFPTSYLHIVQPTHTSGAKTTLLVVGGGNTGQTASTEINQAYFNFAQTYQWATGALSVQRMVLFDKPTYSFVGASTLTYPTTVAIVGSPVKGTNATFTQPMAFWVQAGGEGTWNTYFGGLPSLGGGSGVMGIENATTNPGTNPVNGGILYATAGAGTWRGSGGTVTSFGPAGPHCGECGYDEWTVATLNVEWKSFRYQCGHCGSVYAGGPKTVHEFLSSVQKSEYLRKGMTFDQVARLAGVA